MANRRRGEITAEFDNKQYTLCLTLGALAELEDALGGEDILALLNRFEQGRLRSHEVIQIITAGLRGSGHDISESQVAQMTTAGSLAGFIKITANLLSATFANEKSE